MRSTCNAAVIMGVDEGLPWQHVSALTCKALKLLNIVLKTEKLFRLTGLRILLIIGRAIQSSVSVAPRQRTTGRPSADREADGLSGVTFPIEQTSSEERVRLLSFFLERISWYCTYMLKGLGSPSKRRQLDNSKLASELQSASPRRLQEAPFSRPNANEVSAFTPTSLLCEVNTVPRLGAPQQLGERRKCSQQKYDIQKGEPNFHTWSEECLKWLSPSDSTPPGNAGRGQVAVLGQRRWE
ncbi:hypothetical protein SKAU_G00114310 [Synaphobranchus kaupii]|uniref:Uncharacterized protein n=1 Tax=Synaphobranchus kaupii TaxID=118154 RepID=A0A9Q1J8R7_SYNKA|nr:hypothetical protein SKAU_G00114310 [Synaphobranchus kaupii]